MNVFNASVQLRILCLIVFLLFSPSLYAELSLIDDADAYGVINRMSIDGSPWGIFLPGSEGGAYYRPLVVVSYLWDKYVWLLDTRLMHLDNILFHVANSLLVFWLVWTALAENERENRLAPFGAALLFGIHPIVVESVAWLSGRTDVMAGTFVLLAAIFLLKYKKESKPRHFVMSVLFLFIGLLFKEVALGFFIAIYFLLRARDGEGHQIRDQYSDSMGRRFNVLPFVIFSAAAILTLLLSYEVWPVFLLGAIYYFLPDFRILIDTHAPGRLLLYLRQALVSLLGFVAAVGLFFLLRRIAFKSDIGLIPQTISLIFQDPTHALRTYFGAAGFYVKKFFMPLPLNVAIREIDPLYQFLGILVFFFCLYLLRKRTLTGALFLTGVFLFAPALPLSFGTVAWTAYAERYIYIATAFWAVATALFLSRSAVSFGLRKSLLGVSIVLFVLMSCVTLERCITWQTNTALLKDAVEKSPRFRIIRNWYMVALLAEGDYKGARQQYEAGIALPSLSYDDALDINMAVVLEREGKREEAVALYEKIIEKSMGKSETAHANLDALLRSMAHVDSRLRISCYKNIIDNADRWYKLNNDPYLLYQLGKDAVAAGDKDKARRYFAMAVDRLPEESEYKKFARAILQSPAFTERS